MPSFKTPPELSTSAQSPYDDLNRLERNLDRNSDRNPERRDERNLDRNSSLQLDERRDSELRVQGPPLPALDRSDREPVAATVAPVKISQSLKSAEVADPLIQGLFCKLPEPETEWPLAARQKWLQTAANIFDLMYAPHQADAGELAIRVERNAAR